MIAQKVYLMPFNFDVKGKVNCVTKIRVCAHKDLGYSHDVEKMKLFSHALKKKPTLELRTQNWNEQRNTVKP